MITNQNDDNMRTTYVLSGQWSYTSSIRTTLKELFGEKAMNEHVRFITEKDVHDETIYQNPANTCIIIPGIIGEDSPYNDIITDIIMSRINTFLHEGGNIIGLCAGGTHMCQDIEYTRSDGVVKKRKNLRAPFNARSIGPIPRQCKWDIKDSPYDDMEVVNITITPTHGDSYNTSIGYGNGSYFHFTEDLDRQHVHILARYSDIPEAPVAAAQITFGDGKLCVLGIHPETSTQEMEQVAKATNSEHLAKCAKRLKYTESSRVRFAKTLFYDHIIR